MTIWELIVIAFGLAMDAFAVSICKGLSLGNIKWKHMCIAGLWFGGFQAMMPAIGFMVGRIFANRITKFDHWVAFILLLLIGANMIRESFGKDEEMDAKMNAGTMFVLAVATSIDALAVGVSFAFLEIGMLIIPAVILIGVITFAMSAAGVKIGSVFGTKYRSKAELVGGIILILIGCKILIEGILEETARIS